MSERDINAFKIGSEKLNKFYKLNSRKIFSLIGGINEMPKILYKAIAKDCGDNVQKIVPYKFAADFTFNHTLPSYLRDQGIIYNDAEIKSGDVDVQLYDDI